MTATNKAMTAPNQSGNVETTKSRPEGTGNLSLGIHLVFESGPQSGVSAWDSEPDSPGRQEYQRLYPRSSMTSVNTEGYPLSVSPSDSVNRSRRTGVMPAEA